MAVECLSVEEPNQSLPFLILLDRDLFQSQWLPCLLCLLLHTLLRSKTSMTRKRISPNANALSLRLLTTPPNTPQAASPTSVEGGSSSDTVPTPKVIIDQDSDPDATIVEITFGDHLGALLDTMNALKNLGLNVIKAKVFLDSSGKHNTFAITRADTGRKVDNPELLEATRLTIINNMLEYHPESSAQLAMGEAFGIDPPKQKVYAYPPGFSCPGVPLLPAISIFVNIFLFAQLHEEAWMRFVALSVISIGVYAFYGQYHADPENQHQTIIYHRTPTEEIQ